MNEPPKNIKIIIISVLSCFVLIVVCAAISALTVRKPLDLYNINQINSELSSKEISSLEDYIWKYSQDNFNYDDNKKDIQALIRPSSFEKMEVGDSTNYSFLIDIDELKITYQISFSLIDHDEFYESPEIKCATGEQTKYPDTPCVGRESSPYVDTAAFLDELPYYFDLPTGEFVTVTLESPYGEEEYLEVRVSSCGDAIVKDAARAEVQSWISSFGYNANDYDIKIPEFCDGSVQ